MIPNKTLAMAGQAVKKKNSQARKTDLLKLRPQSRLYIALEDMDLTWYKDEVATVIAAYNSGMGIVEMADTCLKENLKKSTTAC
jgi:mannitol-specific phosphotransferase system IIBC component